MDWYDNSVNLSNPAFFAISKDVMFEDLQGLYRAYKNGELGGGEGTSNHAALQNLYYNTSGHMGFSPDGHTHNGYEATANKNMANGYAPLDSNSKVPTVNLGGSGADETKYLRGDQTWQTPSGGSGLTHPQVLARSLGC